MNPFSERYKEKSNEELLLILNNEQDYQNHAVLAAKEELNSRNLSEIELSEARNNLETENKKHENKKLKKKARFIELEQSIIIILKYLNPFPNEINIQKKFILYVSLLFIALPAYKLYQDLDFIKYLINPITRNLSDLFWYYLPYLVCLIGGVLYLLHKKAGWYIVSGLLSINLTISLIFILKGILVHRDSDYFLTTLMSGYFILSLIVNASILYINFSSGITTNYSLIKSDRIRAFLIGLLVSWYFYAEYL